jgi:hypothetical protein
MDNKKYVIRIVTRDGKIGYYIGFSNFYPYFQAAFSKKTKIYKSYSTARKQLGKIRTKMMIFHNTTHFEIAEITNLQAWTPFR